MTNELKKLKKIPNVNEGGCGIIALTLYRIFGGTILKLGKGWLFDFQHYGVEINGKVYDSKGVITKKQLNSYESIEKSSEEELVERAKIPSFWNRNFDRKHIDTIEKISGIDLTDIK